MCSIGAMKNPHKLSISEWSDVYRALRMLVEYGEAEFWFDIWAKSGHDECQWVALSCLQLAIKVDSSCLDIASIVFILDLGISLFEFLSIKIVKLEANTKLRSFWISIDIELHVYLNISRRCGWPDINKHLRIVLIGVRIATSTSCCICFAPFWLEEECLVVLDIEESTQEYVIKVSEEVWERHPEYTIFKTFLCSNSGLSYSLLLHSLVSNSLSPLIPLIRLITPWTKPLNFVSPRISQLH